MDSPIEISTHGGMITSTSSALAEALAEAMAELSTDEYRADEEDLIEVVSYDLDEVQVTGGVSSTSSAA